jgi:hypothetical protein
MAASNLADLALLLAAFHQAFLDFQPEVIAPAPLLFRLIQASGVVVLLSAALLRRPNVGYPPDVVEPILAGATILFLVFSFIAWMEVEETASLLMVRVVFRYCPALLCLLLIVRLGIDVLQGMCCSSTTT